MKNKQIFYSNEEKAAFAEEKNATYRQLLGRMSPKHLPDDVRNTLKDLRTTDIKMAIGDNRGVASCTALKYGHGIVVQENTITGFAAGDDVGSHVGVALSCFGILCTRL